jgi:hypothetical protein
VTHPRPTRRWVKGCGLALILAFWTPVLVFLGGMGLAFLHAQRVEAAAAEARRAVTVGSSLSDAILSSSGGVGDGLLPCYEAACLGGAPEALLAQRRQGWFSLPAADGPAVTFETLEEWRRHLRRLDELPCRRVRVTFCGRPRASFLVEMDGLRRVAMVGPLGVTAD